MQGQEYESVQAPDRPYRLVKYALQSYDLETDLEVVRKSYVIALKFYRYLREHGPIERDEN